MDSRGTLQGLRNASLTHSSVTQSHDEQPAFAFDEVMGHMEYKVAEKIWQIGPVLLFLFGTIGNVWTLVIMRQWNLGSRSNNMQVYMIFLAVSDLMVLYSGLLRNWITWTFGRDVRLLSTPVCKGHTFLVYVSIYVSTWLLVIMTLERTCSACMPTRISSLCTRRRAYITIISIVLFHVGLHLHFLRTTVPSVSIVHVPGGTYVCDAGTVEYGYYIHRIWPVMDVFLLSIIPSALVLLGNLIIVWKAKVSLWTAQELNVSTNSRARRKRFSSMTVMLGLISSLFVLTSLPTCVYNLWERTDTAIAMSQTPRGAATIELMWAFVNVVMYCNNTFNFYLYLLSGRKFRKAVSRQLSRRRTESQSNVISGYSFQLHARFNHAQDSRNGHASSKSQGNGLNRKFQLSQHARKQCSVKYKPCDISNQSNAYL
ncbi:hypothetical protein EGW08_003150 [Elysia chlorotica]|uniref:G-protein coupled receptors family 1 profile domain-containing protein n=1 Tax=Elysia chlorotica TaxID=188477 RepID=A0A3S1CCP1_ELYCH|nr:hypothetical protein EGW08_003150 [Elysia chlorotica]